MNIYKRETGGGLRLINSKGYKGPKWGRNEGKMACLPKGKIR